jgi:hypothetical protein
MTLPGQLMTLPGQPAFGEQIHSARRGRQLN